jgi:hypothetical protein
MMQAKQIEAIEAFQASAENLVNLLSGRSEAQLDWRPSDCDWSIRQNVHHLADDLDVWAMCIKKALVMPGAVVRFEGFPGNEAWADGLHFDQRTIQPQLDLILAQRRAVAALVEHFADAWGRSMCIADSGGEIRATLSVADILKMLTDHTNEHVAAIQKILKMEGMSDD